MKPVKLGSTLRQQLTLRLVITLVAAFIVVGVVSFKLYQAALKHAADLQVGNTSVFYQGRLSELDEAWEREALRLKTRLEFTRLLEDPATRKTALRSYFAIQGDDRVFSHILILDTNSKPLLAMGMEDEVLHAALPEDPRATKSWFYDVERKNLYRVYQQPIWLGQEGSGRLLLRQQIDNGLLYTSAIHNTQLFMLWEQVPVASSLGMQGLEDSYVLSGSTGWNQDGNRVEQRLLKWGEEAHSPSLLVRQKADAPFSSQGLLLSSIAIMGSIMAVVWWALGSWMSRMAGRVALLGAASRGFAKTRELTPQLSDQIKVAVGRGGDEIHDVANAFVALTAAVEEREEALERKVAERTAELKVAKERSEELNRMLHTVLDTIPVRIFWKDRNLVYLGCNRLFAQDAGKSSPQEVIGATDYDMGWREVADLYRSDDARIMETMEPRLGFEEPQSHPDGTSTWLRTSKVPLRNAAGEVIGVLGTYEDITEERLIAEALLDAKDAAEAASRAKSEFLASMSHELRTPLNAVLGFSQLLGMDTGLSEDSKEQAREIERAGQHLLSLVNDLIDLARIEAGKLELSLEAVPVKDLLADSFAMVAPLARKQGIELKGAECHCNIEQVSIRADYVRLRQVVINLLSNAIKYNTPQGTVSLFCLMNEGKVRISVTDTGIGIPADRQARIFNAFDRLGAERGTIEGSGIGLVITKRFVEAMGGGIGFESIEGQGSTFWVEFPVSMPCELPVLEAHPAGAQEAIARQTTRPVVLYIEDNPMNLRLMQQIFAIRKDLELRDAHTAELGIELARAEPPALILMDINLPGMDGYAALASLKADPKTAHIPVIAISANAMKGDEARGFEAGFVNYITKPINIPALFAALDKLRLQ